MRPCLWGRGAQLDTILGVLVSPRGERSAIAVTGPRCSGRTAVLDATVQIAGLLGYHVVRLVVAGGSGRRGSDRVLPRRQRAEAPRLLVVDDADRADPGVLLRLLEVVGSADGAADRTTYLVSGAVGMPGAGWLPAYLDVDVTFVELPALPAFVARAMVAEMAGAPPCCRFAALVEQVGGNPRQIRELVTGPTEGGAPYILGGTAHLAVCCGDRHLDDEVPVRGTGVPSADHRAASRWIQLGDTERAIAGLVGTGLTNRQIARHVSLSPHTVNYYLRRIYRKLDVASRVELAALAVRQRSGI